MGSLQDIAKHLRPVAGLSRAALIAVALALPASAQAGAAHRKPRTGM